ncbi:MAG: pyridoxal phosphate-dependent aminotransferase [Anaerolineae bacterium]|nr:pyridoxal phosphate-dependent aminotransferase [Anaerolineae bacterium]
MKELSRLLSQIPPSATLAINDKAKAMQAAGHDVIALAGGEPDFDTPAHIVAAAFTAIEAGYTHYPAPTKGITPTLEAIAEKMAKENNVHVNPKTDVIVTPGSKWALILALSAVINPGDEVLYLSPAWVSYPPMIQICGGIPIPVDLDPEDNYTVTAAKIRARLTPKSKAIMVNSPCNPTGRVLTQAEVQAIAEVAIGADLYVVTDEVYEKLRFDGRPHYSLAAEPGMAERTLTTNGLSKSYAMTGWRMGWVVGPTPAMKLAAIMHSQTVTSAATFTMKAAIAALRGPQDIIQEMCQSYQDRRDYMVQALNEIPGVHCPSIDGAFYLMPSFPNSQKNSVQLADALLEKAGIAGTPGIEFGATAENRVRFSIATAMNDLERAVERIAKIAHEL